MGNQFTFHKMSQSFLIQRGSIQVSKARTALSKFSNINISDHMHDISTVEMTLNDPNQSTA